MTARPGVRAPDLGGEAQELILAPWMVLSSGAVLSLAVMSVNLVGDAVRDMLEPLKGRALT